MVETVYSVEEVYALLNLPNFRMLNGSSLNGGMRDNRNNQENNCQAQGFMPAEFSSVTLEFRIEVAI